MKTKITNWITLISLAGFVIFFSMGVKSQQKENNHIATKQDSIIPIIGLKIPDSTVVKVQDKSMRITKIDSLKAIDSDLAAKNEIGIKTAMKKKERFDQYKENRKTPNVYKIPIPEPSLATKLTPPGTPDLKKKGKRSVLDKLFHRNK